MSLYSLLRPLLYRLDPERAHDLTLWALERGLVPSGGADDDPLLGIDLWGRRFANPIGLAAGFDKDARVMGSMLGLGFGFVEVGSVTPRPQAGNPKPRIFRLVQDRAVINRLGFNNAGMAAARDRLAAWRAANPVGQGGPVGINIGKNKETVEAAADYALAAEALGPFADYMTINVSSPNTPGLRALQSRAVLEDLIGAVRAALVAACAVPPPLLLKIAPDLTPDDRADIAAVALAQGEAGGLDGLIVSNTTIERPRSLRSARRGEAGGLSGAPLLAPSTALLADMHRRTEGRVLLVGVGGVASGADAYAKIRAGATLVQLYSGLVYGGPGLVGRITRELAGLLRRDGLASPLAAVGLDAGRVRPS